MALGSHLITVRRLEKYINDVIGKKANLPDTSKTIIGNISQINSNKQNKTDNALTTTAKSIVGAINEINSGLTGLFSYTSLILNSKFVANFEKNNITKAVKFIINIQQNIDNGQVLGTLPPEFRPVGHMEFYLCNGNSLYPVTRFAFKIETNGQVRMDALDNDTYCSFDTITGFYTTN
jgi:hypothetical protein